VVGAITLYTLVQSNDHIVGTKITERLLLSTSSTVIKNIPEENPGPRSVNKWLWW
jgi:hypothetical protein